MKSTVEWLRPNSGRVLPKVSILIILIFVFVSTSGAAPSEEAVGDLYAIVVGVAKYKHPKIQQLTVSDKDAKDFAEFLKSQNRLFRNIHVALLRNEEATKSEVEKQLYYKLRRAGKDDTVVLFFSGHGADDPNLPGEFFFLTHDADPDYLAASAVHMSRQWFLQKIDSRRVVFVADACHAGGFAPQGPKSLEWSIKSFMHQFRESEGKVILTSSRPDERSLEKAGMQNSIFTHYLLLGLKGEADTDKDGVVSLKELYDFVYNKTKDATGGLQHPQWEGKVVGTIPIALVSRQDRILEASKPPQLARPPVTSLPANDTAAALELLTEPAEADVFILGKPVGTSNKQGKLLVENLPIGQPVTVVVRKKGWLEASVEPFTFFSGVGPIKKIEINLKQARGSLDLLTVPPDADVYAGDRFIGRTNPSGMLTVTDLPLGEPIHIKAKRAGWLEASIDPVTFSEDRLYFERRINLAPAQGSLALATDPGGAEVYLDGKLVGITNRDGSLALEQLPIEKPLIFKIKKKKWLEASLGPITFSDSRLRIAVQPVRLKPALGSIGLFVDHPGVDVYAGDRFVGRTDASGRLTVTDLPLGEEIYIRAKKPGWQEASIGPLTFSEDKLHVPDKRLSLLRAQGTLGLISEPGGAEVYLDGKPIGLTGQDGSLVLDKLPIEKPLTFKIKKKDWLEASLGPISFSEDKLRITDQRVRLERAAGSLEVLTDPSEAEVWINDNLVGATKKDGKLMAGYLPLGTPLHVRVKKQGWLEASVGPITLSSDTRKPAQHKIKLKPAVAALELQTDPGGVAVKMDGRNVGTTDRDGRLAVKEVRVAVPHALEFQRTGYEKESLSLSIPDSSQGATFENPIVKLTEKVAAVPTALPSKEEKSGQKQDQKAEKKPSETPDKKVAEPGSCVCCYPDKYEANYSRSFRNLGFAYRDGRDSAEACRAAGGRPCGGSCPEAGQKPSGSQSEDRQESGTGEETTKRNRFASCVCCWQGDPVSQFAKRYPLDHRRVGLSPEQCRAMNGWMPCGGGPDCQ